MSDGLFLKCCREIAAEFPEIKYDELIVDNACMQLVMRPETFDCLVLPNLYGDIVSDLAAGLVGGLGIVPGANLGEDCALFEAVHGTAPDIAGQGIANPIAAVLSAAMLMRYSLNMGREADRVDAAVSRVLEQGHRTRDIAGAGGKTVGTREMGDLIVGELERGA